MDISKIKNIKEKILNNGFAKDVVITTIGQIIVMLVTFGLNKVVSNTVSVDDFGAYNLIRRAANVIAYVMIAAMGIAVPKYLAEYAEKKDERNVSLFGLASLSIVLLFSIAVGALLLVFPQLVTEVVFGDVSYVQYVLPMLLYAATSTLFTYSCAYYRGIGDFKNYNYFQIIMQLVILVVTVLAGGDLLWIFWGWSIAYVLLSLFVLVPMVSNNLKTLGRFRLRDMSSAVVTLMKYGLPRIPGEFVLFAYSLLPLSLMLQKFGMTQSSYFSCAISIMTMITPLFSFVGIVLLPMASKSVVNKDTDAVNRGLQVLGALYIVLSVCAIGFVELFPEFVIAILFSEEYYAAIPIIRIVIMALLPNAIYLLLRNPIDGITAVPYNTYSLMISFVCTLVMMWFAKDVYSCAWAYVLGYVIMGVMSFASWKIALWQLKKQG